MLNKNVIIIGLTIFLMSTITTSVLPVNALAPFQPQFIGKDWAGLKQK
jgi:hypothetical protein